MKTKFALVLMISIFFQLGSLNAQENTQVLYAICSRVNEEPAVKVGINKEIINRFNQCETDGKLITWSDLVLGFDSQSLTESLPHLSEI